MAIVKVPSELLDVRAYCDPAGGKATIKKDRARSAIVVVAADPARRFFVRHIFAERCSTQRLIEQLFFTHELYSPAQFGIEAVAQQGLFADSVKYIGRQRASRMNFIGVSLPSKMTKEDRIRWVLQPVIEQGRLFWLDKHFELQKELRAFPQGTIDLVDALASCISLFPKKGTRQMYDEEVDDLRAFLSRNGSGVYDVDRIIAEVMRER